MASVKERKRALQEFMASPKSMDAICNSLHLISGSQVHKDLLRAIVQITAYAKEYVKDCGLLEPRKVLSDSTLCTLFEPDFQALVDRFLVNLRAGVIFFPVILPNYDGWTDSFCTYWERSLFFFWAVSLGSAVTMSRSTQNNPINQLLTIHYLGTGDRLQWSSSLERDDIRVGILLMFENIKNNGIAIDLTGAEVYESFTTDDCGKHFYLNVSRISEHPKPFSPILSRICTSGFTDFISDDCGGEHSTSTDDIVYCDACRLGHHQSCYDIYPKPVSTMHYPQEMSKY
jgi:hypothetical protein